MGNNASTPTNPDESKTTTLPDDMTEEDSIILDQGLQGEISTFHFMKAKYNIFMFMRL